MSELQHNPLMPSTISFLLSKLRKISCINVDSNKVFYMVAKFKYEFITLSLEQKVQRITPVLHRIENLPSILNFTQLKVSRDKTLK